MTKKFSYVTDTRLEKILDKRIEKFAIIIQAGFKDVIDRFEPKLSAIETRLSILDQRFDLFGERIDGLNERIVRIETVLEHQ